MSNDPIPGTLEALNGITDGTGLNVNKMSEIVQVDGGDANSFDEKLDAILQELCGQEVELSLAGYPGNDYPNIVPAIQKIKRAIVDEIEAISKASSDENDYTVSRVDSEKFFKSLNWWLHDLRSQSPGEEMTLADELAPIDDPYGILDEHDKFVESLKGEERKL